MKGLLFFSKDKSGGTAVADRPHGASRVVDLLTQSLTEDKDTKDPDWKEIDVLLRNWQADVLRPKEEKNSLPAAKVKPISEKVLDKLLEPEEQQTSPDPITPRESQRVKEAKIISKKPSLFRSKSRDFLELLKERTNPDQEQSSIPNISLLKKNDYLACRVCGNYVPREQLINSVYCSSECQKSYALCSMCHRPFIKEHEDQQLCTRSACQLRYVRKPGIGQIKYILVKE